MTHLLRNRAWDFLPDPSLGFAPASAVENFRTHFDHLSLSPPGFVNSWIRKTLTYSSKLRSEKKAYQSSPPVLDATEV